MVVIKIIIIILLLLWKCFGFPKHFWNILSVGPVHQYRRETISTLHTEKLSRIGDYKKIWNRAKIFFLLRPQYCPPLPPPQSSLCMRVAGAGGWRPSPVFFNTKNNSPEEVWYIICVMTHQSFPLFFRAVASSVPAHLSNNSASPPSNFVLNS